MFFQRLFLSISQINMDELELHDLESDIDAALRVRQKQLKGSRSAKLGVLTRKKNEITELMKDACNIEIIKTKMEDEFSKAYKELNELNDSVKSLLSEDDVKRDQREWYAPRITSLNEFMNDVSQWMEQNITLGIGPADSISNVQSQQSRSSRASRASLKIHLESEQAELTAKAERLKRKQQLERQEAELKAEREELELETQMAANAAKLSILKEYELSQIVPEKADQMNEYLEAGLAQRAFQQEENDEKDEFEENELTQVYTQPVVVLDSTNVNTVPHVMTTQKKMEETATLGTLRAPDPAVRKKTVLPHQIHYAPLDTNYVMHSMKPPEGVTKDHRPLSMPFQKTSTIRPSDYFAPSLKHQKHIHSADAHGAVGTSTRLQTKEPAIVHHRNEKQELTKLVNIMENQNRITECLVKQQGQFTLPPVTIPIFKGDPLDYQFFIRAFEYGIERKTESCQDRLYFLEQFTLGQPRELVRSCQYMHPDRGYIEAKKLLRKHFGDDHKIAISYLDKAVSWPVIKTEDAEALQAYSVFLNGCMNAMNSVEYLEELNHPTNMKAILSKLPYKIQERWRAKACEIQDRTGTRAAFSDLVEFVSYQSRILSHPLFGSLNPTHARKSVFSPPNRPILPKDSRPKGGFSGFATGVSPMKNNIPVIEHADRMQKKPIKECLHCKGDHSLNCCPQLKRKNHEQKLEFLKRKGVCFGCLEVGHMSKGCQNRPTCQVCSLRHPTILHIIKKEITAWKGEDTKDTAVTSALVDMNQADVWIDTGAGVSECKLAIIPVKVKMKKSEKVIHTYAFMDPGSSATFCTESLLRQLQTTGSRTNILLRTMNQEKVVKTCMVSGMEISGIESNDYLELPEVYSQSSIPVKEENIPNQKDVDQWPYLHEVKIPKIEADIGLLIGNNVPKALEPWIIINSQGNGPYAIKTSLGWTVNGPLRQGTEKAVMANRISLVKLEELLQQQMKYDFPERQQEERLEMSQEDLAFLKKVSKSVTLHEGHYVIGLPLRDDEVKFPNNRCLAEQRAIGLRRKLSKNIKFHEEYKLFMADILRKGFAVPITPEEKQGKEDKAWYIPHHGVYHPKKHKLRVVFDCGATYQGMSLNSQLLQGPDLTNNLTGVLTRFRQEAVAFIADVEAMFHQVKVPEEDSGLLRFLWWPDGNLDKSLEEYKMVVHIFGATSSPSCATFALQQCARDNVGNFDTEVTQTVLKNFYVDDCLKSVRFEKDAITLAKDLLSLCATGGFKLNKWISNSRSLLLSIPEQIRAREMKDLDLDQDILPIERALGVQWCIETDSFIFKIQLQDKPLTRRGILSMVSSIYDPLGMLAPLILSAKQVLQELCGLKLAWDDRIPEYLEKRWMTWLADLPQLNNFRVRRCFVPEDFGSLASAQLHHFADASESGYGTVTYLRLLDNDHKVRCAFVMGKARVVPLKPITIPRLELTASTVAVRMDRILQAELDLPLKPSVYWTDSTSVLKYLRNETSRYHTFVANRVTSIRAASNVAQWRYVNGSLNPADCASRGISAAHFLSSGWIQGPEFLQQPESEWPKSPEFTMTQNDPEVKVFTTNVTCVDEAMNTVTKFFTHYSDWHRLRKAVAWILKVKGVLHEACKEKKEKKATSGKRNCPTLLSMDDLQKAEMAIIQFCQSMEYKDELVSLKKGMVVRKNSHIHKLNPIFQDGIIRVGGRLVKSAMPSQAKHPSILPKDHHVTTLIIRNVHESVGHSGRNHTLSSLRQKYWIPRAHSAIRKVITKCVHCRRLSGVKGTQFMSDLPEDRLLPDEPPFTNVGIDFFGPFEIKRGRTMLKRYGVIFTCLNIRAVHLEVAHTLNTDSCINAIRRFVARRGTVKVMRSDNGTNLIRAERELRESIHDLDNLKIHSTLLKKGITWKFNPPAGSHHGGVWERQIRTVRRILGALVLEQTLDEEGLTTLLCEVEAIINDRPITKATNDPLDLEPLTPNHLLLLKGKPFLPPGVFTIENCYAKRRWRQVQYMADLFWKRWTREYLPELQERQKWTKKRRNFVTGDIVLIVDDSAPRNSWVMGRIAETLSDKRGFVRQVKVQTKTSTLIRPITKLALLLDSGR